MHASHNTAVKPDSLNLHSNLQACFHMNIKSSDTISGHLLPCMHIYHGAYSLWQVWNLEFRQLVYCLQWEANMTAFAVVQGTYLMCATDTDLQMI